MGYNDVLNRLALQSVVKPVARPNVELAIDHGEDLRSQQLKIEYQTNKQFVVVSRPTSVEQWQLMGAEPTQVDPTQLKSDYWFGDPRGAF